MLFRKRSSIFFYSVLVILLLGLLAVFMIGPYLWLLSTSLKSGETVFQIPPNLIPKQPTLKNFTYVWESADISKYFLNSIWVSILSVILNLLFSAMVAYPLARLDFTGKKWVFIAILSTMIIPFQSIMLPVFFVCKFFGITNSFLGVVMPTAITALGVYLLRQSFLAIPKDLEEAARVDGCSEFRIWYQIMLPLIKPSLTTLAIITFTASWSDFLWPLIVLQDPDKFTLPVGMQYFMSMLTSNWQHIAAVSIIASLPMIILFLILQKYFYAGSLSGSVKG